MSSMGVTNSTCTSPEAVPSPAPPGLDNKERKLILQSWSLSESGSTGYENCGQRIFNKIFSLKPEIEPIFSQSTVQELELSSNAQDLEEARTKAFYKHVRAFMNMLELAVSKSDQLEDLKTVCIELGKRHAHFGRKGFKIEYWDIFESAIVECALEWEGSTNQKTLDAWSKLVKYIIYHMQMGYNNEIAKAVTKA